MYTGNKCSGILCCVHSGDQFSFFIDVANKMEIASSKIDQSKTFLKNVAICEHEHISIPRQKLNKGLIFLIFDGGTDNGNIAQKIKWHFAFSNFYFV